MNRSSSSMRLLGIAGIMLLFSCSESPEETKEPELDKSSIVERLDPELDAIISTDISLDTLASGFTWSEGPLWVASENALLFTDVPENVIHKWSEKEGLSKYLEPAGYLGERTDKHEDGANGLILDQEGNLLLCQHGERQVAMMNADLNQPEANFISIASTYNGKPLNSPNDLVMHSSGKIFFTDPPYGLDPWDSVRLDFAGVYSMDNDGNLALLIDSLSKPNGIALSPDESKLYIAVSDPDKAAYYAYELDANGNVTGGKMLLDVTPLVKAGLPGLPDGLKVDPKGNLFASGPGGILILSPQGKHLGTIKTGQATSNCAFNSDYTELFMTAHMYLMRVKL